MLGKTHSWYSLSFTVSSSVSSLISTAKSCRLNSLMESSRRTRFNALIRLRCIISLGREITFFIALVLFEDAFATDLQRAIFFLFPDREYGCGALGAIVFCNGFHTSLQNEFNPFVKSIHCNIFTIHTRVQFQRLSVTLGEIAPPMGDSKLG